MSGDTDKAISVQVPAYIADYIYSVIPGNQFNLAQDSPGYYTFPCDYEVNITFIFGGVEFPIHPLDIGIPSSVLGDTTSSDANTCIGTVSSRFQSKLIRVLDCSYLEYLVPAYLQQYCR